MKKNNKTYLQLPDSFNALEEIELFQLKDNFWLISAAPLISPTTQVTKEKINKTVEERFGKKLSNAEISVLKKLMKIRFAERTTNNVEKTFTALEKTIIRGLIKKDFVQIFHSKSYKNGVYNIPNEIYPHLNQNQEKTESEKPVQEQKIEEQEQKKEIQKLQIRPLSKQPAAPITHSEETANAAKVPGQLPYAPQLSYSELVKTGWMVVANSTDAEQFSFNLKKSGFSQNVKGIRGFDGKFYIATNKFLQTACEKIKSSLEKKKERYLQEIADEINFEPDAVSVVLYLLAESGEVIEKRRGLFCLA